MIYYKATLDIFYNVEFLIFLITKRSGYLVKTVGRAQLTVLGLLVDTVTL